MKALFCVFWRTVQHLRLQAVDVAIDAQALAVFGLEADELFGMDELQLVDVEDLQPSRVHLPVGIGTEQPMQTGLKRVVAPAPTRRQPSRRVVHLEDFGLIAALLRVDRGAKSGDTAANDDDLSGIMLHVCELLSVTITLSTGRTIAGAIVTNNALI